MYAACTVYNQFIVFRKFLKTEDGDDVLQFIVTLENTFYCLRRVIVIFTDDQRIKDTGCTVQWIYGRIDTKSRNLSDLNVLFDNIDGALGEAVPSSA